MPLRYDIIDSPIGPLTLAADDSGLKFIEFEVTRHAASREGWQRREAGAQSAPGGAAANAALAAASDAALDAAAVQLREYFAGHRRDFELPLAPAGTAFQRAVWQALAKIPYGQTCSYAELARAVGRPKAVRAVGAANGRNPLPIVLPCHRVIGADGSLTGFGGGLPTKVALLRLESGHDIRQPAPERLTPRTPASADLFD